MSFHHVSRRGFGLMVLGSAAPAVASDMEYRRQRRKLAQRRRRITYNDDGGGMSRPTPAADAKEFLSRRFDWTKNTQVDAYCWNTKPGWFYPPGYLDRVSDPARVTIDAAREAGMEAVATMRMNDIHEAFAKELFYPFKIQHRDMLMEPDGAYGKYPSSDLRYWFWASMNFARPEVRQHKLGIISDLCEKYSPDVFEMDFLRGPKYFKSGEEAANRPVMTEFVRSIRRTVDELGRRRGRPMLLSARFPDTIDQSVRLGLDAPAWLKDGLLDLLIIGLGYAPFCGAWKEFAALARKHEVPSYPVIDSNLEEQYRRVEPVRAAAMTYWGEGAEGIYLFNPFVPVDSAKPVLTAEIAYAEFKHLGSPGTLAGLDKVYCQDDAAPNMGGKAVWVVDVEAEMPLPTVVSVPFRIIPIPMWDDFGTIPGGKRPLLVLRLRTDSTDAIANLQVRLNGRTLGSGRLSGLPEGKSYEQNWIDYDVEAPVVRRGVNHLAVALTKGETILRAAQLCVRYV